MQNLFTEKISKYISSIKSSLQPLKISHLCKAYEFYYCLHGGAGIKKSSDKVFVS